jgi:prepilin-type N-terminal cleavage/methylation domain-containing protein
MRSSAQRAFTLIEVMLALAILAMGLAVLIKDTANNIAATEGAQMDGVVADLARYEMGEIEEKLQKEGFQDMVDHKDGNFADQGWESITWEYKIEPVELPDLGAVQTMASKEMQAKQNAAGGLGSGSGVGSGSGAGSGSMSPGAIDPNDMSTMFGNSALGGMMSMFGGMGGMGMGMGSGAMGGSDAKGAAFIQSQYELVKQVLKASIRKVTLTIKWEVMNDKRSMDVVQYITDGAGMNTVLGNIGADGTTMPGTGGGSGSGSGSGTAGVPR